MDPTPPLDRRRWLQWLGASALVTPGWRAGAQSRPVPGLATQPFAMGVASGSPSHDSVVLWTRLMPAPGEALNPAVRTVSWELADDEGFQHIVQRGTQSTDASLGLAVHAEVRGLAPERWYHYRFMVGDAVSPVGRTRTFPAPDTLAARLRFAFASCQRWEHGYYAAWRHLAGQAPDLVVFLGDYIYEYASPRSGVAPGAATPIHRVHTLPRARTLADYRDRYALHRSDPDLQAAHAACPWLVTWDDHEVENDYAAAQGQEGATPEFIRQRSAAYQAFYENMPLHASVLLHGLRGLASPEAIRLYGSSHFGRLASFHLLDDRQYRALQACRQPGSSGAGAVRPSRCAELQDPARTLLGAPQEAWLADALGTDARTRQQHWSIIGQQTLFSTRRYGGDDGPVPTDPWDGYPAARQRLTQAIIEQAPRNTVLIGGDIHQNYVCRVQADAGRADSPTVASEFCGTSITSHSGASPERARVIVQTNPHVLLAEPAKRGYAWVDLTPQRWQTSLLTVDDPGRADSGLSVLARFEVEDGRPGPQRLDG